MYVKNRHGRIVDVNDARGAYLLDPNPVLLNSKGKPRLNAEGEEIPVIKSESEKGYTKPTQAEIDAYVAEERAKIQEAEEVAEQQAAAVDAATAARMASHRATMSDHKRTSGGGRKKKAAPAPAPENTGDDKGDANTGSGDAPTLEAQVRDAENDKTKYDALTDEGKEMYLELFGEEPKA